MLNKENAKVLRAMANKIRSLRNKSGMNQYQLAEIAGVTASEISQLEVGNKNPSLFVAIKIANALHISIDELAGSDKGLFVQQTPERTFFRKYQSLAQLSKKEQRVIVSLIEILKAKKTTKPKTNWLNLRKK